MAEAKEARKRILRDVDGEAARSYITLGFQARLWTYLLSEIGRSLESSEQRTVMILFTLVVS